MEQAMSSERPQGKKCRVDSVRICRRHSRTSHDAPILMLRCEGGFEGFHTGNTFVNCPNYGYDIRQYMYEVLLLSTRTGRILLVLSHGGTFYFE